MIPQVRKVSFQSARLAIQPAAVFLVLLSVLGCRSKPADPPKPSPVNVHVRTIEVIKSLPDIITLPGAIEPYRLVSVSAEVDGRIEQIHVKEGQPCRQGQLLVGLNTDILQSEFDQARAQAEFDRREYERVWQLVPTGAVTQMELDLARTKLSAGEAYLRLAQARLQRAEISAPISGIIDSVPVEIGEYVQVGGQVAKIVEVDRVKVVVDGPEKDVGLLKLGAEGEILTDSAGTGSCRGTITYISALADERTRTSRIELTVDNPDHLIRTGQIVRAHLTRRLLTDVIMIPLEAVIPLENGAEVYVVEDGLAQPRHVELGLFKGYDVQVVSGLQQGDRLIVSGHRFVGPGQTVRIVE